MIVEPACGTPASVTSVRDHRRRRIAAPFYAPASMSKLSAWSIETIGAMKSESGTRGLNSTNRPGGRFIKDVLQFSYLLLRKTAGPLWSDDLRPIGSQRVRSSRGRSGPGYAMKQDGRKSEGWID